MGGGSLSGGLPTGAAYAESLGNLGNAYGITLSNSTLNAGGGNILMDGHGGINAIASGGDDYGIYIHGSMVQTSSGGNITLTCPAAARIPPVLLATTVSTWMRMAARPAVSPPAAAAPARLV